MLRNRFKIKGFVNNFDLIRHFRKYYLLYLLLFLTCLFRLYYVLASPGLTLTHDEIGYDMMAKQFLKKGFLGYYSDKPNAFVTPGYPLFLSIVYYMAHLVSFNTLITLRVTQVFISVVNVFLVFAICRKCNGYRTGLLAALLAAVYPSSFMANNRILTEVVYCFFLLTYIYLIIIAISEDNFRLHALSGIVVGLTVLVRPAVIVFLLLPYVVLLWQYKRNHVLKNFISAMIMFSIIMFPWWVRNYMVFDKVIVLATQSGNPLLRGTDPYDPYDKYGSSVVANVPEKDMSKVAVNRIKKGFQTNTWYWLKWFTMGKFMLLWKRPWGMFDVYSISFHQIFYFLFGWLGTFYNLLDERLKYPALLIMMMTVVQLAFIPIERYMYPLTPLMAVMAASLLSKIAQRYLTLKT